MNKTILNMNISVPIKTTGTVSKSDVECFITSMLGNTSKIQGNDGTIVISNGGETKISYTVEQITVPDPSKPILPIIEKIKNSKLKKAKLKKATLKNK